MQKVLLLGFVHDKFKITLVQGKTIIFKIVTNKDENPAPKIVSEKDLHNWNAISIENGKYFSESRNKRRPCGRLPHKIVVEIKKILTTPAAATAH